MPRTDHRIFLQLELGVSRRCVEISRSDYPRDCRYLEVEVPQNYVPRLHSVFLESCSSSFVVVHAPGLISQWLLEIHFCKSALQSAVSPQILRPRRWLPAQTIFFEPLGEPMTGTEFLGATEGRECRRASSTRLTRALRGLTRMEI